VTQRYFYGPAVDQILAVDDCQGRVLWGLADHEGTVRDVAEYDDGSQQTQIVEHRRYDAFGKLVDRENPSGGATLDLSEFDFAYTGRPRDEATGLYNYRARWYDAALGRFLSEDPLSLAGGDVTLYRYVGNNPMNAVDPSGTMTATSTLPSD
jgi:RHS repeat-associated protein